MPYDGDGPDIFRAPSGKEFCVPQPLGSLYEQYVIDKIMEVHKIEILNSVYVAIHAMTQDIANIEGSEEKIETPHAANE